jgi:hypothetical protein
MEKNLSYMQFLANRNRDLQSMRGQAMEYDAGLYHHSY